MQYDIKGGSFPVVVCKLDAGEKMITEKGSMVCMQSGITMETSGGGIGKMFSKAFAGESMFQNIYTAEKASEITFGSSFPGEIVAIRIAPENEIIVQKGSFLASEAGVELSIHFRKKLSTGFFGGEGFIMQKLSGRGVAFLEIDGALIEYDLAAGEKLIVDTGNVAGYSATVDMSIQQVKGIKNKLLGGEGFFNTVLTGPGRVWVQTMPVTRVADALRPFIPTGNG